MGQSYAPFLLPSPLMKPPLWPAVDEASRWLLPLDVATVAGGPLKKRFEDLLERDQAAWFLPSGFFQLGSQDSVQREIRWREAAGWLKTFPGVRVYSDHPEKISPAWLKEHGWRSDFLLPLATSAPTLFAWAKEIFPLLTDEWGELKLRSELQEYSKKMPTAEVFPWEELRFFAGHLRKKGPALARLAATDWARFQALFSPQNEEVEARRLSQDALILNPTTQILRSAEENRMSLIFRWNHQLHEEVIGWREAYLIDEVSEAPKTSFSNLLRAVEAETTGLTELFARRKESESTTHLVTEQATSFPLALDSLIQKHVLLRGL